MKFSLTIDSPLGSLKWFFTVLGVAWIAASAPIQALTLTLKPQAAVPGKEFFVSDLIQVRNGISPEILAVKMGPTPTFKEPALITPPMIEMALKAQTKVTEPISWEGAKSCSVVRPSRFISTQDLVAVILPALGRITGGEGTIALQEFAALSPMEIPAGRAQGAVEINPSALTNEWSNASVSFLVDGGVVLSRSIRFHWSWVRDVLVAQKELPARSKIEPTDFRRVQANALQGGSLYVSDVTPFAQFLLAKPLKAGAALTQDDIEQKKLVYKGGKVMVHYAISGLEVKMMAVALEDGIQGASISVMNPNSHVHMLARVVDQNSLEFIHAL